MEDFGELSMRGVSKTRFWLLKNFPSFLILPYLNFDPHFAFLDFSW